MAPARSFVNALLLVAATLVSAGCGSGSDKVPKTAVSWGATAQRAGEAWLAGEVPRTYARRTARAAREALVDQRATLREDAGAVENAAALAERIDALARSVRQLEAGLAEQDREAVARALTELETVTRAVTPWARGGGGA
jgi:hypothetical protein